MRKLILRARLALWAFRNPDTLTMLHVEMLRDAQGFGVARIGEHPAFFKPAQYARRLRDMPGASENIASL